MGCDRSVSGIAIESHMCGMSPNGVAAVNELQAKGADSQSAAGGSAPSLKAGWRRGDTNRPSMVLWLVEAIPSVGSPRSQ